MYGIIMKLVVGLFALSHQRVLAYLSGYYSNRICRGSLSPHNVNCAFVRKQLTTTKHFAATTSMTEATEEGEVPNWSSQLQTFLDEVEEPLGSFATSGQMKPLPFSCPKIYVDGVGRLTFPVVDMFVEPLKAVATKTPSAPRTWQIDAFNVTIEEGPVWTEYFRKLVRSVCIDLGVSDHRMEDSGVSAILSKMLLYEKGNDDKLLHLDNKDRVDGKFGTLLVQLPSAFSGGIITVDYKGDSKTFAPAEDSCVDHFHYLAFYNDCNHHLHPVESGFRLCLLYDLVAQLPNKPLPTHSINVDTETTLRLLTNQWMAHADEGSQTLGYRLTHEYTRDNFGVTTLKGRDEIVRQTLTNAKSLSGEPLFTVHLVLIERYVADDWGRIQTDYLLEDYIAAAKVYNSIGTAVDDEEDWTMYQRSDGWLIPEQFWVDEEEEEEFDTYLSKVSMSGKNSMFLGMMPNRRESDDYGIQEFWYYVAAIVISPRQLTEPMDDVHNVDMTDEEDESDGL